MEQEIIHDGDIDITVVVRLLKKSLLIIAVSLVTGAVLGGIFGRSKLPEYEVVATVAPPEVWQYKNADLANSVLFNFVNNFAETHPEYGVKVTWQTQTNTAGNTPVTTIQLLVLAESLTDGTEKLDIFRTKLTDSDAVQAYFTSALSGISKDRTTIQFAEAKQYELWQQYNTDRGNVPQEKVIEIFTSQIEDTVKLQKLSVLLNNTKTIEWLMEPTLASANLTKQWYVYSFMGAFLFGFIATGVALLPGFYSFTRDSGKKK